VAELRQDQQGCGALGSGSGSRAFGAQPIDVFADGKLDGLAALALPSLDLVGVRPALRYI
jgi:hypothetical protein